MGRRLLFVFSAALAAVGVAAAIAAAAPQGYWLSAIGADPSQAPGPGVPIAIIDSGTDATHPEFAGRPNTTYLNSQTTVGGKEWHGTAVASAADSVYPTSALEIFDASPTSQGLADVNAIQGILAAAQHCPAVISLSFGTGDRDSALDNAIVTAQHNGCLVVAAAGNVGQSAEPVFPASLPHVFTVAATDETNTVASYSIASAAVDVAAPGSDITVAVPTWENPTGYETESGTSFAAPIAAAAAAWVWTLRPTLTPYQLAQVLRLGAKDIGPPGFDNASGAGLIDIPGALAAAAPPNDPLEPNDDISQSKLEPALGTASKPTVHIAATLDQSEDPRDVYRIWVPANRVVRVSVTGSDGNAAARIWGPQTVSTDEGLAARRRDLRGPSMKGGRTKGSAAYVEVLLTGRSASTRYVLNVTASKK